MSRYRVTVSFEFELDACYPSDARAALQDMIARLAANRVSEIETSPFKIEDVGESIRVERLRRHKARRRVVERRPDIIATAERFRVDAQKPEEPDVPAPPPEPPIVPYG